MSKGFRRPSKTPNSNQFVLPNKKENYPKKDLGMLISFINQIRKPSTDEIFEQIFGEHTIMDRLSHA